MKSDAYDPNDERMNDRKISPTTIFDALSHERRQFALQYLSQRPAAVPLGDVAEYIALREGDPSRDRYERVLTGLYHCHLPRLTDASLVRYDANLKTVELITSREELSPYLDLVTARGRST